MGNGTTGLAIGVALFSLALSAFAQVASPVRGPVPQPPAPVSVAPGQTAPASAQSQASFDRAQWEGCIRVMKAELERGEARVSSLTAQLVTLDDDIESRVNRMVNLLSSVRDSTDGSSVRMRKAKDDALDGLKASAIYYAQQRDQRQKAMLAARASIADDDLARDVAALNARIETRVTQSLAIASSLTQYEEGPREKYHNDDINYQNETREYRRMEHDASASVKIKTDLMADLKASIDKLTRDVKAWEAELQRTTDPQRQEELTRTIATTRQTIDARRDQMEELVTAQKPGTRAVASKAAFEMDKMLDEMTVELKKDFAKFKRLVAERDEARARIKPLEERLKKNMEMLETLVQGSQPAPGP